MAAKTEKDQYVLDEQPDYNGNGVNTDGAFVQDAGRHGRLNEAADLYGNAAEAEEYGYVTRGYVLR